MTFTEQIPVARNARDPDRDQGTTTNTPERVRGWYWSAAKQGPAEEPLGDNTAAFLDSGQVVDVAAAVHGRDDVIGRWIQGCREVTERSGRFRASTSL